MSLFGLLTACAPPGEPIAISRASLATALPATSSPGRGKPAQAARPTVETAALRPARVTTHLAAGKPHVRPGQTRPIGTDAAETAKAPPAEPTAKAVVPPVSPAATEAKAPPPAAPPLSAESSNPVDDLDHAPTGSTAPVLPAASACAASGSGAGQGACDIDLRLTLRPTETPQ